MYPLTTMQTKRCVLNSKEGMKEIKVQIKQMPQPTPRALMTVTLVDEI